MRTPAYQFAYQLAPAMRERKRQLVGQPHDVLSQVVETCNTNIISKTAAEIFNLGEVIVTFFKPGARQIYLLLTPPHDS